MKDAIINKLESIAVDLYNQNNFKNAKEICEVLLSLYDESDDFDGKKRIDLIVKKLELIENYVDTNRDFLGNQLSK